MKLEAVKALRDHLKTADPNSFRMSPWLYTNECGTAGCLAGHVCIMTGKATQKLREYRDNDDAIAEFGQCVLGLTREERRHMFLGFWSPLQTSETDINRAIAYLDKVIETGNVFVKLED